MINMVMDKRSKKNEYLKDIKIAITAFVGGIVSISGVFLTSISLYLIGFNIANDNPYKVMIGFTVFIIGGILLFGGKAILES